MNTNRERKPIGADAYEMRVDGSMQNAYFEQLLALRAISLKEKQTQGKKRAILKK